MVTVNDELVGLPLVGQIRRAHPDLIVASEDADPLDLARASAATHAAVYVEPGESLDGVERGIDEVGLLTGRPVAARHLSAAIARTRRRIAARLSGYKTATVFIDVGSFGTVGSRTLLGDLVLQARGKDVAGPAPEQGPYPLRQLAKENPDVYLTTSDSGTTLDALRRNHLTKRLKAVRDGRFGIVPARLTQPGPEVATALVDIAKILHPDAFATSRKLVAWCLLVIMISAPNYTRASGREAAAERALSLRPRDRQFVLYGGPPVSRS
jgi:iron complex transport system substrate-binding protein